MDTFIKVVTTRASIAIKAVGVTETIVTVKGGWVGIIAIWWRPSTSVATRTSRAVGVENGANCGVNYGATNNGPVGVDCILQGALLNLGARTVATFHNCGGGNCSTLHFREVRRPTGCSVEPNPTRKVDRGKTATKYGSIRQSCAGNDDIG